MLAGAGFFLVFGRCSATGGLLAPGSLPLEEGLVGGGLLAMLSRFGEVSWGSPTGPPPHFRRRRNPLLPSRRPRLGSG